MAWLYFSSALVKVCGWIEVLEPRQFSGVGYLSLARQFARHKLQTRVLLPQIRQVLPVIVGLVLLWELAFPLAVFWRRSRGWILGFGVLFHLMTLFFMNLFFPYQLAMYLISSWERAGWIDRPPRET